MRLQKYIAKAGICSRRNAEKAIEKGFVKVNGNIISKLGTKIDPDKDRVEYKEKVVKIDNELIYIALNKPEGYITSCSHKGAKIVLDIINIKTRIYPIGRLDKDTSGLLLLTNDGALHHRLLHPSFDHEKRYKVTVKNKISDNDLLKLQKGVYLDKKITRRTKIDRISKTSFYITLKEGRNRQIRRMVKKIDNKVIKLKRISFANIQLGNLKKGKWRYLTENEKKLLSP
jgi:23S rRNA pseudouridine2605 synthase